MPSAVPISAGNTRDEHGNQNSSRSFRSMGGFGARSFSAQQGLSFTGPGSFVVSPRFGSYSRAAALLGTSLGKSPIDFEMHCGSVDTENGLPFKAESEFCKNYNCCGMELNDLHDLIQHYEEAHVVVLDDSKDKPDDGFEDAQVDDMDLSASPSQDGKMARMSLSAMAAAAISQSQKSNNATSAFETSILHSNPRGAPTSLHAKAPLGSFGPPFSPNLESEMSSQPTSQDDDEMFDAEPSSSMSSHSSQAINSMPLFPTNVSNNQSGDRPQCVTPGLLFPSTGAQKSASDAAIKALNGGNSSNSSNTNNATPTNTTPNSLPPSNTGTPSASGKATPTSTTPTPAAAGASPSGLAGAPDNGEGGGDKPFKCPNPGCSKAYRQANGLKYHRLHGQCNYVVRDGMEQDGLTLAEAEAVARPYLCQVGHCDKRYKNMNGLRYHYAHSGAHGAIGLAMLSNGTHPTPPPPPAHVRERKDRERKAVAAAAAAAGLPPPQSPDGDDDNELVSQFPSATTSPHSHHATPIPQSIQTQHLHTQPQPRSSAPATPTMSNASTALSTLASAPMQLTKPSSTLSIISIRRSNLLYNTPAMGFVRVAEADRLKENKRHVVTLRYANEYQTVVLFRMDGLEEDGRVHTREYYAIESNCPHAGAPLENASLELVEDDIEDIVDVIAVCPYHAYDLSLSSGESSYGIKACTFNVEQRDEIIYIDTHDSSPWEVIAVRAVSEQFAESTTNPEPLQHVDRYITPDQEPTTLTQWATLILKTPDPELKIAYTRRASQLFKGGQIKVIGKSTPPEKPPRNQQQVDPSRAGRRGKGGSLQSRIALLHSLANIELWAIDLAWDIIARFSNASLDPVAPNSKMPMDYFSDWLQVATDEAKHFSLLRRRLEEMGSFYGALPTHGALWDSAEDTKHSLISRLSIIHLVHEARGLDVNPATIAKFRASGDLESTEVLETIHHDEITHVTAGHKWMLFCCKHSNLDPIETFRKQVKLNFSGKLRGPFNTDDRHKAGLSEGWYNDLQGEKTSTYKPTTIKSVKEEAIADALKDTDHTVKEDHITETLKHTRI
ncbi:hypothetical protein E3P92_00039 [Wallemia ichthyophaga]|uniref:Rieske domain-containing protein n=2 Tax=Wallemia ichthyophaga TaxID=245174 RepID=A0A4T0GQX1_WALIC|nr:hypothetical protein E3P95_00039 [Wallemia ichthyophaga]TIB06078.1 hypothetical protein E3P94_00039 [Wallemia ichthyophaga]TIB19231.1 hypothetical protein E3P92_00039 [Wallemia ichthyophaga]TIB37743.1 hypothetical protein E3P84_00039 [Wallemia ichthyophaga]TIB39381.1 hypothetical protein E3P86_01145 [Wallemia ichthyophaga]